MYKTSNYYYIYYYQISYNAVISILIAKRYQVLRMIKQKLVNEFIKISKSINLKKIKKRLIK